uniref:TFIID subunit TAF5 NTD2 domain-containing protein n=1 Tax=Ditylenchus dipsaci TaxID=166011 RepID=A0A915E440_9BILA
MKDVDYVERSALDYHKVELAVLLYPVFAHLYIQAIRTGQQSFARTFLSNIVTPLQIQNDELVNALLTNTFLLKISRPVLKQLESFMGKNSHIQEVIASHVTLEAVDQPIRVQSAIASELGGVLGQRSKQAKRRKQESRADYILEESSRSKNKELTSNSRKVWDSING